MPAVTKIKDPAERKDYGRDWTDFLATVADTITESEWEIDGADDLLDDELPSHNETVTKVYLKAGTLGASYTVTNTITTAAGLVAKDSFTLAIQRK